MGSKPWPDKSAQCSLVRSLTGRPQPDLPQHRRRDEAHRSNRTLPAAVSREKALPPKTRGQATRLGPPYSHRKFCSQVVSNSSNVQGLTPLLIASYNPAIRSIPLRSSSSSVVFC